MALADDILGGAMGVAQGAGQNLGSALGAYQMAQETQRQREQLNIQKDAMEMQKANNFLSQLANIQKLPDKAQDIALKHASKNWGALGVSPEVVELLNADRETRNMALMNAAEIMRKGGPQNAEESKTVMSALGGAAPYTEYLLSASEQASRERGAQAMRQMQQMRFEETQDTKATTRFTDYGLKMKNEIDQAFKGFEDTRGTLQSLDQQLASVMARVNSGKATASDITTINQVASKMARAVFEEKGPLSDADIRRTLSQGGLEGRFAEGVEFLTGTPSIAKVKQLQGVVRSAGAALDSKGQRLAKAQEGALRTPEFKGQEGELRRISGLDSYLQPTFQGEKAQSPNPTPTPETLNAFGQAVSQARKAGMNDEQIRSRLQQKGASPDMINKLLGGR